MKKQQSKVNVFLGLIFIIVMVVASIYTTPKVGLSQQHQQISFDFPTSYAHGKNCQRPVSFDWAGSSESKIAGVAVF